MSAPAPPVDRASKNRVGQPGAADRHLRTRPRRTGMLAASFLVIVGFALAGVVAVQRAGGTVEILAVHDAVFQGQVIERENLIARSVSGVDEGISGSAIDRVVGLTATVDLLPGQFLTDAHLTDAPVPGAGEAVVGLQLSPARAPTSGLLAGDTVTVIGVLGPGDGDGSGLDAPPLLAERARVLDTVGSVTEGGYLLVTLIVDERDAARVAAHSTADRVAIVQVSPAVVRGS